MDIPFLSAFFGWISKKSESKFYVYAMVFIVVFFFSPFQLPYSYLYNNSSWGTAILKSHDLTNSLLSLDPASNGAKKVFRLTVPLLMGLFHLTPLAVLLVQYIWGFLLLVFTYKLSIRILNDPVSATFITAGLVLTYFGSTAFFDMQSAWFDSWCYFLLIMALYSRNVFGIFLFATFAAWTDERAFIALPIVLLFHQISAEENSGYNFKKLISLNKKGIAVLAAIAGYLILRLYLQHSFNMHTPTGNGSEVGLAVLHNDLYLLPLGMWTFLEGFWLLFIVFILIAVKNKNYLFLSAILAQSLVLTIAAGCVLDITRSGAYLMPVIFLLCTYARNHITINTMQLILLTGMIVSFIFPPYFVEKLSYNDIFLLGYPAPLLLIKQFLHICKAFV